MTLEHTRKEANHFLDLSETWSNNVFSNQNSLGQYAIYNHTDACHIYIRDELQNNITVTKDAWSRVDSMVVDDTRLFVLMHNERSESTIIMSYQLSDGTTLKGYSTRKVKQYHHIVLLSSVLVIITATGHVTVLSHSLEQLYDFETSSPLNVNSTKTWKDQLVLVSLGVVTVREIGNTEPSPPRVIRNAKGINSPILFMELSENTLAVVPSNQRIIEIWNIAKGIFLYTIKTVSQPRSLKMDGDEIYIGNTDGLLRMKYNT